MPQMLLSSFSAKDGILPEDLFRQAHLPSGCKKYLFTYRRDPPRLAVSRQSVSQSHQSQWCSPDFSQIKAKL